MEKIYLLMNKPRGYVCSAVSDSHKTVYQLLPADLQDLVQNAKRGSRLHTVGRLDCDTGGLLLFTNDGFFSHRLTEPASLPAAADSTKLPAAAVTGQPAAAANLIEKVYLAELESPVPLASQSDYIRQAATGLTLPPEKKFGEQVAAPAKLEFLGECCCHITVHEGKFHEVRRIFQALGNRVTALKRIKMGPYELPADLEEGKYISISPDLL